MVIRYTTDVFPHLYTLEIYRISISDLNSHDTLLQEFEDDGAVH
jgi:hypothetical protein